MADRTAIVVGGGISGLSAAIGLSRRGWRVRVLERSPGFGEVGAGISLWPNAMRALDVIDPALGARVRDLGGAEVNGGIRRRNGQWVSRIDVDELVRRLGTVLILHRADLLASLLDAVPAGSLEPGTFVSTVDAHGTVDGAPTDLVVGADGLRSAVRQSLWPQARPPRYSGYTAWRLITRHLPEHLTDAGESWGRGTRFGYAGLPDGRAYCYATDNTPEGESSPDEYAELIRRFGDWHEPVPTLLAAAAGEPVLRHDIYDLPDLTTFARGRAALAGDAAHAMTPNLGQGACQALEDVATLVSLLDRYEVPAALVEYDRLRRRRTQAVVRLSRRTGDIGQWSSPVAVALRDRLLALVPPSAALRTLVTTVTWEPPSTHT